MLLLIPRTDRLAEKISWCSCEIILGSLSLIMRHNFHYRVVIFVLTSLIIIRRSAQDDYRAFRRQLEDKRIVIESNLLSGRQYVANEPLPADTNDMDSKFLNLEIHNIILLQ